jgi:hypothetical protein
MGLGLDTFGDVTIDADGHRLSDAQVIRNVVEEAVLADRLGLDFIGIGEHHRDDFAVSAPEVVLAAIAGRTERIRLGSAVTVLSSDDPVRVYQRFATLHALSRGRAAVIVGRDSFTESFPLFGTRCPTTSSCSRRSSSSSSSSSRRPRSPGAGRPVRGSMRTRSTRAPMAVRSRPGSVWAGHRSR